MHGLFVQAATEYLAADRPLHTGTFVRQFASPLPMRLLFLIPALFLFFQPCVLVDVWPFQDEVPGWADLRDCLTGCLHFYNPQEHCPPADALGCHTRECTCLPKYRESALETISSCVKTACIPLKDEQQQGVDIFNNFCGGVVIVSSVGASTAGSPPSTQHLVKTVMATDGAMPTSIDEPMGFSPTQPAGSTAQRGVALLWGTFITMIMSLMAVTIWGWMAV